MEDFHAQQIQMGTAEHVALQKFEPVDVSLRSAITPRQGAGSVHSGIVSTNPVDKAAQFGHLTGFCSLQPGVQCLHLAFFEHGDKLLAQEVDGAEVLVAVHLRNLLLLHLGEFRGR